jgi:hypothetical protein
MGLLLSLFFLKIDILHQWSTVIRNERAETILILDNTNTGSPELDTDMSLNIPDPFCCHLLV